MPSKKPNTNDKVKSLQDLVPSALKAVEKTIRNDTLPYQNIPTELLVGKEIDLSSWSLVATDHCLGIIATQSSKEIVLLNLSGAEKVTDVGLQTLSKFTSNLQSLNLDNAYRISSVGLAAITKNCQRLTEISLSGCLGIDGAGFGMLSHCHELTELRLSGCRQINPWAFNKIFESCKQLQTLDISFCSLVTDQEMKVLSERASGLKRLNVRDCKLISDVGLSYLSQGCAELEELNLRRNELPFRITDVALLQLGQACKSLLSLNLHGCEMISDTGLSWLSQWSLSLRHINLSNCSKVTNAGIRHLGEGCTKLRSIVLLNLKRVSDVGIRCMAACHHLEALNGSGLCMLSDGVDRSFGLEGTQALGASDCSATIKHLNLHGCALISTLSMKAIANFSNLETLDLSGCNKLTLAGSKHIGKSCTKIRVLSLAICGDCISNTVVEALVSNLNLLSTVNLQFCSKVGERSMKALSTCSELQRLDLTGCSGLTDQAILHLSEGNYSPGLRHLFLAQCSKIGDTSLSWITDGLKQTLDGCVSLETLSLKGTKVTANALRGLQDRFPYSVLKSNSSYIGLWPLTRVSDRKVINTYHKRSTSAAIIQARVRTMKERDTLRLAREKYCRKRVAILVGAVFRGRAARRLYRELKRRKKELLISSLRLQCAFRCRLARKRLGRQKEKTWLTIAPISSVAIQRRWRGVLGRRLADTKRLEKRMLHLRKVEASVCIQSWCRMLKAKQIKLELLNQKLTLELNQLRSSIKIQSVYRMHLGKQALKVLKAEFAEQQRLERVAAARIQSTYQTLLFRSVIKRRVERTKKRLEGTLTIQQWYRNEKARILAAELAAKELAAARLHASELIQRNVRRRFAYLQVLALRQKRDKLIALRDQSATTLCRWGRLCIAKVRVQKRRLEFDDEIRRALVLKIWASTKIAACWRGKLGRDRANACIVVRAHRWKAMFDENEQRAFYYNQDTGQTTWNKPQVLLNLEPKPICSNCSATSPLLAEVECKDCSEFFCTTCFEFIHRGGRRAQHSFKLVYDYYGNRRDYDNEPWQEFISEEV